MKRVFVTAGLVVLGLTITAYADEPAPKSSGDLKQVCEDAVNRIGQGDLKAFDDIWKHATQSAKPDEIELYNSQLATGVMSIQQKYGKYLGCVLCQEKEMLGILRRYVYVAKYEQGVITWKFVLYRPNTDWKILSFEPEASTGIDSLFEQQQGSK